MRAKLINEFEQGGDPYEKLDIGRTDSHGNIRRRPNYTQVCIWPGTSLGENSSQDLEDFILDTFGTRTQYLENLKTSPDDDGPGGRDDMFFAVHTEDIGKFAVPRMQYNIKWIEDFLDNGHGHLHPDRIKHYRTW